MRRSLAASISCGRHSAGMRSPPSRRRRSTRRQGLSASPPRSRIPQASGCPRSGRSARSARRRRRGGWARRSHMLAATPSSPLSASLAKTISTRLTLKRKWRWLQSSSRLFLKFPFDPSRQRWQLSKDPPPRRVKAALLWFEIAPRSWPLRHAPCCTRNCRRRCANN